MRKSHKEIELKLLTAPRKAAKVLLDAGMTTGEAFRAIVTSGFQHLFENEGPALWGEPGGIHQVRVALRAFKRSLPYEGRKAFNGEFRWLQQRLEPPRDWHVFLHEALLLVTTGRENDPEISHLRRIARDERWRTSREAAKGLTSKRNTRLTLRFEHWLAGLSDAHNGGGFDKLLAPFTRKVLAKTYRDLTP